MENQRLTKHFNLYDFLASETALLMDIENVPHEAEVVPRLARLAELLLEPVLAQFNTRPQITSGYRCPALNERVGGSATSQHMMGCAVDFQLPGTNLLEVVNWMKDTLDYDQLLLERSASERWIHVSYVAGANRKQVKWFDGHKWHEDLPETWS